MNFLHKSPPPPPPPSLSWLSPNKVCWYKSPTPSSLDPLYKKAFILSLDPSKTTAKIKLSSRLDSSQFLEEKFFEEKFLANIIETSVKNLEESMCVYMPQGFDNMVKMTVINEAEILSNFISRFNKNMLYTYIDDILIYIHNTKAIESLFSKNNQLFYAKMMKKNLVFALKDFPAHLYAIIANSLQKALENKRNQAFFFFGLSGAGKSLNFNKGIEFLASLNNENLEEIGYNMNSKLIAFFH